MKRNIKKILIVITLFISTILFTNKVDAVVMYLDCYVDSRCATTSGGFSLSGIGDSWKCKTDLNRIAALTNNDGSVDYYLLSYDSSYYLFENEDYCWLSGDFNDISNSCDDDTMYEEKYAEIINAGYCPLAVRTQKNEGQATFIPTIGYTEFVPVGKTNQYRQMEKYEDTEYIIYSFIDASGNEVKIAEGYNSNGAYCYAGPNIKKFWNDEILYYQRTLIKNTGGDYFKVASNFDSLLVSGTGIDDGVSAGSVAVCKNGEEDCISNHGFRIIIDSNDSNSAIYNAVENWYNDSTDALSQYSDLLKIINKKDFDDTCIELNSSINEGKNYSFGEYDVQELITDLEKLYDALEIAYGEDASFIDFTTGDDIFGTDAISSAVSYIYANLIEVYDLNEVSFEDDAEYYLNLGSLKNAITRTIEKKLEEYLNFGNYEINIVDATKNLRDYVLRYYTTTLNLISNSDRFMIKQVDYNRLVTLKEKFANLIEREELNIYPVTDCKSLIGDELLDKINSYLNIIKIAVPILLIGLGVLDFTKAIFSSDEESMKKAQKIFVKRLAIAIIIFLTPTIVNLILQLANKVWLIISPNSCGLFE